MLLQANRVNSSPPNILLHIRERPQPVAGELKGKQDRGQGLRGSWGEVGGVGGLFLMEI